MNKENLEYKKLFEQKKYSELIFLIQASKKEEELSAGELNLLGVTRLLVEKNEKTIKMSLKNFEKAYLKDKNSKIGLDALKNFINLTVDLYKFPETEIDTNKTLNYFKEARNFWGYDKNLMLAIKRLYWRLNEVSKVQSILFEMIKIKNMTLQLCVHIFIAEGLIIIGSRKIFLSLLNSFKKNNRY
jgi:hypothetical protein